jgi:hypothetical protein
MVPKKSSTSWYPIIRLIPFLPPILHRRPLRASRKNHRPATLAGMHFFNPAPVMKLVEIIKGKHTDDAVTNLLNELCLGQKSLCTVSIHRALLLTV